MLYKSLNACYLETGLIFNFVVVGWGEKIDVGGGYRKRDRLQNFFNSE